MEFRHGDSPDVVFPLHQAAGGLETVVDKHPDRPGTSIYVIVLPRRGKADQPYRAVHMP